MRWCLLAIAIGGCATVHPWEREALSQPAMAEQPSPETEAFEAHYEGAREAALDPGTAGGGGCGCN